MQSGPGVAGGITAKISDDVTTTAQYTRATYTVTYTLPEMRSRPTCFFYERYPDQFAPKN